MPSTQLSSMPIRLHARRRPDVGGWRAGVNGAVTPAAGVRAVALMPRPPLLPYAATPGGQTAAQQLATLVERGLFPVIHAPTDSRSAARRLRDARRPSVAAQVAFFKAICVRQTPVARHHESPVCTHGDDAAPVGVLNAIAIGCSRAVRPRANVPSARVNAHGIGVMRAAREVVPAYRRSRCALVESDGPGRRTRCRRPTAPGPARPRRDAPAHRAREVALDRR